VEPVASLKGVARRVPANHFDALGGPTPKDDCGLGAACPQQRKAGRRSWAHSDSWQKQVRRCSNARAHLQVNQTRAVAQPTQCADRLSGGAQRR
jgi:hypothetical protein